MKICIAQTESLKGKIHDNIKTHLRMIRQAVSLKADLIIFPELSITSYEPALAQTLATSIEDEIFASFQTITTKHKISIGVGMPTKDKDGIYISMLIFHPNQQHQIYSKQMLHTDELPYFVCGSKQTFINVKGKKIAVGICYETLQREHFLNAKQQGADVYIASVAKPKGGIIKAFAHFPNIAKAFQTPILMANCIGFCDNFLSVGQSAVWNKNGKILTQLDSEHQGLIIFDTESESVNKHPITIKKGQLVELKNLFQIYQNAKNTLQQQGIYQWTDNYPTKSIVENDLKSNALYTLKFGSEIIGSIVINEEQDVEYQAINWKFDDSKVLVIHRLVINPKYQKQGYAQKLMDFAENYALENEYTSIRLDVYSRNVKTVAMYKKRAYHIRGEVYFSGRKYPFHCMEKVIYKA